MSDATSKETVKSETVPESSLPKLLDLNPSKPPPLNKTNHTPAHSPDQEAITGLSEPRETTTEDGEIFSDDEEAAYYPQHVRSRPQPKAASDRTKSDAEKSDTESPSNVRSGRLSRDRGREKERNLRSSPESETDSTHHGRSDTKELGFFEDRDGSGSESAGSRDRTRSRSRERDREHRSSPKYGRNRNRERDRGGTRSRNDDDSGDRSSHHGRQMGGYGRTKGVYGGYQQRGGYGSSKFQAGGGYTSSVQPGLMNTGMTAQQFHNLALKVKQRKEDGLPLLPQPNLDKCGNLDQYNYPAPPSWYLEEVENWEKREKEEENDRATSEEKVEQIETKAEEVKLEVEERTRPISPLFRRTSSVALEIVSSPVSDDESSMVVVEPESHVTDSETVRKGPLPLFESDKQSHDIAPETKSEPVETTVSAPDVIKTSSVKPLKELASAVQADNECTPSTAADTAIATASIATTTTAIATASIATTTTAIATASIATTAVTATNSSAAPSTLDTVTPQSLLDLSTSTADTSSLSASQTAKSPTQPPPKVTPLTITTESITTESDDDLHSPSLSPTIPIQSSTQMKVTAKGAAKVTASKVAPKPTTFRPKLMSDSESEGDYDDYLDQLDQEEDEVITEVNTSLLASTLNEGFPLISGSSAPSLKSIFETGDKAKSASDQILGSIGDPLSEDFPSIGKAAGKASSNQPSLMSLIGQDVVSMETG